MRGSPRDAWIGEEPRFWTALRNVLSRAARRPLRMAVLATVVTAAVVGVRARREPAYVATITFRLEEGGVQDPRTAPRPSPAIREYIWNVALNRERILEIMDRHGLSTRLRAVNPSAAIESMRDDIGVDVVRNYFLFDPNPATGPRSAQVVLSFLSSDREQARAVVRDIGAIVLEKQAAGRTGRLRLAREINAAEARGARERLRIAQERRDALLLRRARAPREERTRLGEEIAALQHEIEGARGRIRALDRRAADMEFAHDAEQQRLGLSFHLVDDGVTALREPLEGADLARYAAIVFLLVSVGLAILLGAFDLRLYRAADVLASGFPLLGVVPPLPGSDAGARLGSSRSAR